MHAATALFLQELKNLKDPKTIVFSLNLLAPGFDTHVKLQKEQFRHIQCHTSAILHPLLSSTCHSQCCIFLSAFVAESPELNWHTLHAMAQLLRHSSYHYCSHNSSHRVVLGQATKLDILHSACQSVLLVLL